MKHDIAEAVICIGFGRLTAEGDVLVAGPIWAGSGIGNNGGEALGGEITIRSRCGSVDVQSDLDARGGDFGGGEVNIISNDEVMVSSEIDVSARRGGGDGGDILLESGSTLTLTDTADLKSNGHYSSFGPKLGYGGEVRVSGCSVALPEIPDVSAADIHTNGAYGGNIVIEGHRPLDLGADPGDHSARVPTEAVLDATGDLGNGSILFQVRQQHTGVCIQDWSLSCVVLVDCNGWLRATRVS